MKKNRHSGFTLVEVLIVVVIMAVLAATIIPQFSDSANDAKVNKLKFDLHTLRAQIELYKSQHDGKLPGQDLSELTSKTDSKGAKKDDGAYGPYIQEIPVNPFTDSKTVVAIPDGGAKFVDGAGWLYNKGTGEIRINHADLLTE